MKISTTTQYDKDFSCPYCNTPLSDETEYFSYNEGIDTTTHKCPNCNNTFSLFTNTIRTYTATKCYDWKQEFEQLTKIIQEMPNDEFINTFYPPTPPHYTVYEDSDHHLYSEGITNPFSSYKTIYLYSGEEITQSVQPLLVNPKEYNMKPVGEIQCTQQK